MKILYAASECVPFIKVGGLADVVGTLPPEISVMGADTRVVLPNYRDIPDYWKQRMEHVTSFYVNLGWRKQYCGVERLEYRNVTFYFIDNLFYFGRDAVYGSGAEEGERFAFFCRAVLEMLPRIGFYPDVLHCNDWQTGMIPPLLKLQYSHLPAYSGIKTLFTIHNLRYQGIYPWADIDNLLGLGDAHYTPDQLEFYGCINYMKGALVFADAINTVSRTYAEEIKTPYFGERLDGVLRRRSDSLCGILNGLDNAQYDPATNEYLTAHYNINDLSGKAENKAALQRELGLKEAPNTPIVAMITRLTEQKGLDLVECVLDDIMRQDVQLVVLGTGEERYCELFTWAAWRYTGKLAAAIEHNEGLAQRVYAGADLFLMPSHFEPCGLSQIIAMRYGTIPVVRETGGLRDTVIPYNKYTDQGTGFSFANYNAHEMLYTLERAVGYYHDSALWERMMIRAMREDFSWQQSALEYGRLYSRLTGQLFPPLRMLQEEQPAADSQQGQQEALSDGKEPSQSPPSSKPAEKGTHPKP